MTTLGPLLLVGGGKMGGALLRGALSGGLAANDLPGGLAAEDCMVVEPNEATRSGIAGLGVAVVADVADLPGDAAPRIVLIAVKPQYMAEVIPHYRRFVRPETLFLSIAAGKTIG